MASIKPPHIWAVGGGKGGSGKTLVASSIAIALARAGRDTVAMDADLGGANLHTALGTRVDHRTLADFLLHRTETLDPLLQDTGIERLRLVSGAHDGLDAAHPLHSQKMRLLRHLRRIPAQEVVLDLGGGTGFNTIDTFLAADHALVVTTPEPAAIDNTYRFLKAAYHRRFREALQDKTLRQIAIRAMDPGNLKGVRHPSDLVAHIARIDAEAGRALKNLTSGFRPMLVLNMVRVPDDLRMGRAMVSACRKYFGVELDLVGTVRNHDSVWQAARQGRPLLLEQPSSPVALQLRELTTSVVSRRQDPLATSRRQS